MLTGRGLLRTTNMNLLWQSKLSHFASGRRPPAKRDRTKKQLPRHPPLSTRPSPLHTSMRCMSILPWSPVSMFVHVCVQGR